MKAKTNILFYSASSFMKYVSKHYSPPPQLPAFLLVLFPLWSSLGFKNDGWVIFPWSQRKNSFFDIDSQNPPYYRHNYAAKKIRFMYSQK